MKKYKLFISLLILFLTGVGVTVAYLEANEVSEIISDSATVIERRSATEVVIELDSKDIKNELIVHTNIFSVGDKLDVEYYHKGTKYYVNKVSVEDINISKIERDPTIIKYQKYISSNSLHNILTLPSIIQNQKFDIIDPKYYFREYYRNTDTNFIAVPDGDEITLNLLKEFKVISFEYFKDDKWNDNIFKFSDKTINFTSVGGAFYSLNLEFKNKDVINYIFIA